MKIKNRVKELRMIPAKELAPNPKNWRTHPEKQKNALKGILAEIGYADALLARELPDGSLVLLDGHLRAETTPDQEVPVLVLDLTEEEGDKLLATLDPLAGLAEQDDEKLAELLEGIETDNEALKEMLDSFRKIDFGCADIADLFVAGNDDQPANKKQSEENDKDEAITCTCPRCGHEFEME